MATVGEVTNLGAIDKSNFPACHDCKITYEEMAVRDGKPFLVMVDGYMICGHCATFRATPVYCGCGNKCKFKDKFCPECGQCLKPTEE